jgi:hypothetical protein
VRRRSLRGERDVAIRMTSHDGDAATRRRLAEAGLPATLAPICPVVAHCEEVWMEDRGLDCTGLAMFQARYPAARCRVGSTQDGFAAVLGRAMVRQCGCRDRAIIAAAERGIHQGLS